MALTTAQVLAWRSAHHSLHPVAATSVVDVVGRVQCVRGWPAALIEQSTARRLGRPCGDELAHALASGDVVRTYATGGSMVATPQVATILQTVRQISRVWTTDRFQRQAGFRLDDWRPLRESVIALLRDGARTRPEISAHLARDRHLTHLAEAALGAGADTLYKPLHWWGDITFGPDRGKVATFALRSDALIEPGSLDEDAAGHAAIESHLASYGPVTRATLHYRLTEDLSVPRAHVSRWLDELAGTTITPVEVDGVTGWVRSVDLDALAATRSHDRVTLLPGHDPWLLGPGTADPRIVPPARRALFSTGRAPVLRAGRAVGTWRLRGSTLTLGWFAEAGAVPTALIDDERRLWASVLGRDLAVETEVVD